ncbi:MAG: hypothetical protein E7331_07935 [Clostridiales bacterium]|nr:hypothetical protein [Clostridiales bacterium]
MKRWICFSTKLQPPHEKKNAVAYNSANTPRTPATTGKTPTSIARDGKKTSSYAFTPENGITPSVPRRCSEKAKSPKGLKSSGLYE